MCNAMLHIPLTVSSVKIKQQGSRSAKPSTGLKLQAALLLTSQERSKEGGFTAASSEAWAKLRNCASVAARGRLLLSGSVAHASLETAVVIPYLIFHVFMNEIQRVIVLPIRW